MSGRRGVSAAGRLGLVLLLTTGVLVLATPAPVHASHQPCDVAFDKGTTISLQMTASRGGSPLANGAAVKPGDSITLDLSWNPAEYAGDHVRLGGICFRVGGADAPDLEVAETPMPNDGSFQHTFTVPELRAEEELCARGQLIGTETAQGQSVQRTDVLCFTGVAPEVAPTQSPAPTPTPTTEVLGQQVSAPTPVTPPAPAPTQEVAPQVLGVQTVRLPVTGPEDAWRAAIAAVLLISTGLVLLIGFPTSGTSDRRS